MPRPGPPFPGAVRRGKVIVEDQAGVGGGVGKVGVVARRCVEDFLRRDGPGVFLCVDWVRFFPNGCGRRAGCSLGLTWHGTNAFMV